MNILITGGSGYIGSVLTPALLQLGHDVHVLDNFHWRQNSLGDCCHCKKFQVTRGDCRNAATIKPLITKADLIIPLAALVGMPLCKQDPVGAQTINEDAIRQMCGLISKHQRINAP